MRKILLGAAVFLATTTGAFAQNFLGGNDARIGVKAGVNLSRIHFSGFNGATNLNDLTKDNVGYSITVFGDFGVGNNFFIQPGVSLQNKGTKLEGTVATGGTSIINANKIDVMAIEIPINAVLRIPTGETGALQISAGPYVGFNIDGTSKTNVTSGSTQGETKTDLNFGNKTNDDMASTEFGANFGLGYRLTNGVNFGANYGLGLSNLIPKENRNNDNKAVNRILGFTVGYSF